MVDRRSLLVGAAAMTAGSLTRISRLRAAENTIKIGEINSYTAFPAFTTPYRNGYEMALQEINDAGGILGRKLDAISYDDAGKPAEAVNRAQQLLSQNHVDMLLGTFLSNIGLAVSDFANRNHVIFFVAEALSDALVWEKGNRYTFRLRPSTNTLSQMLAAESAKQPAKRWATIAPNYEYGQSAVAGFKKRLSAQRSDIQWVDAQWPALGKIEAGATVEALARANPEGIYNVLFGADLLQFVREGTTRGLFNDRVVASLLTGEPEYLDTLKESTPKGWIVNGYPWQAIKTPEHQKFLQSYMSKYHEHPAVGSVVGYGNIMTIATAIRTAGSVDTEQLIKAMRDLKVGTPFGEVTFRSIDNQSTMGTYIGRTDMQNGNGVMVDWRFVAANDFFPSDEEIKKMRKG